MRTIFRQVFVVEVVIFSIIGLSGCQPGEVSSAPSPISTPSRTAIPTPAWLAHLPAGMVAILSDDGSWGVESVAPSAPRERLPVTAERAKNVSPSFEIGLDDAGNMTGLPEGKTQAEKDAVKGFYQAIQKKFSTAKVYYNQDAGASGKWILYGVLDGKLIQETIAYAGGPEQYFDYPFTFDDAKGYWEIVGNYQAVNLPGNGELGVIWEEGLPQLLADKATLPNGDSYFKYYMNYKTYAEDQNPWAEVPGVAELVSTPTPEAPTLNPAEMQTESGVHGAKFEFTGQYQGITQNVAVGVVPSKVESISPNGIKLNEKNNLATLPNRLAEASIRVWYAAWLDRNGLTESQYPLSTYIADLKNGKDMSVDEWVYEPATKTSSVVKLGPNTHVTFVSADQLKWYPPPQIISSNFGTSIIKAGANGVIVVKANMNYSRDVNTEILKLSSIDVTLMNSFLWLKTPLEVQQDIIHLSDYYENSPSLVQELRRLVHPGGLTVEDMLFVPADTP